MAHSCTPPANTTHPELDGAMVIKGHTSHEVYVSCVWTLFGSASLNTVVRIVYTYVDFECLSSNCCVESAVLIVSNLNGKLI